ncbi:MAG: hypothetical protein KF823_14415 [Xanthomonadales bacterium]|nr:hypothetical protein [Xanthomonadales bacterium]
MSNLLNGKKALTTALQCTASMVAALALMLASAGLAQAGVAPTQGHAGHWVSPGRSGEGWSLEMLGGGQALLYWFTYDGEGAQRWLTAAGRIDQDGDGWFLAFPQLVAHRGARFGAGFDPADVERQVVGSARISFQDCQRGLLSYQAYGEQRARDLARLAPAWGTRCEAPFGRPGEETSAFAGQSGSWYAPDRNGEGITLQWIGPRQALLTWYTYDLAGMPYWITGVGEPGPHGGLVFEGVHTATGARFGDAFDSGQVRRTVWGDIELAVGCDLATLRYRSMVAGYGEGTLPLQRLTALQGMGCPWRPPGLGDRASIELLELPSRIDGLAGVQVVPLQALFDGNGNILAVVGIGDGAGTLRVLSLAAGQDRWHRLGSLHPDGMILVDSAGDAVVATERFDEFRSRPVAWVEGEWRALPDGPGDWSRATGLSAHGGEVLGVGRSSATAPLQGWRWDPEQGTRWLPRSSGDLPALTREEPRYALSSDRSLFGVRIIPVHGPFMAPPSAALITWPPDQGPPVPVLAPDGRQLYNPVGCGPDCSVMFGHHSRAPGMQVLDAFAPWYRLGDGQVVRLGTLTSNPRETCELTAIDAAATVAVGNCAERFYFESDGVSPVPQPLGAPIDAALWTADTGMVSIRTAVAAAGYDVSTWVDVSALAISADGERILLRGTRSSATGVQPVPLLAQVRIRADPAFGGTSAARP